MNSFTLEVYLLLLQKIFPKNVYLTPYIFDRIIAPRNDDLTSKTVFEDMKNFHITYNLFEKEIIFFPVNYPVGSHWSLIVILVKPKKILYFNSMKVKLYNALKYKKYLVEYLQAEIDYYKLTIHINEFEFITVDKCPE